MGDKMWSTNLDTLLDRNARFWAPVFASRWCIPAYEFSHTLIVGEFLGLAALLGTSAILRLVSLAHQFNCKMRS